MLPESFIYAVIVLQFFATSTYMVATIRGRAQPNRVSWLLWGLFAIISYFASRDSGAGTEATYTLVVGVNRLIIFGLTYTNEDAYWKVDRRDYRLGGLAVIGILLWIITGEGLVALLLAIFANLMAGLPTLIKAYQNPESESSILFGVCVLTSLAALLTVQGGYSVAIVGFPLYLAISCGTMFYFIAIRPKAKHLGDKLFS